MQDVNQQFAVYLSYIAFPVRDAYLTLRLHKTRYLLPMLLAAAIVLEGCAQQAAQQNEKTSEQAQSSTLSRFG